MDLENFDDSDLDLEVVLLGQDIDEIDQIINYDFVSLFKKLHIVSNFSLSNEWVEIFKCIEEY